MILKGTPSQSRSHYTGFPHPPGWFLLIPSSSTLRLARFAVSMACTQVVSVLLSWVGAVIGRQSQASPARSQPSSATQCAGQIVATRVPAYMPPPAMKVSEEGMPCSSTNDHMHSPDAWHVKPKLTGLATSHFRTPSRHTSGRIRPRPNGHYPRNSTNWLTSWGY